MSDACCEPTGSSTALWQVRELRPAGTAAVLLGIAWALGRLGAGQDRLASIAIGLDVLAAVVAGSTFVPGALRGLRHGRISVATLMTIALVGALALGQVAEAALLGILFSVAEGLEHYPVTRTRRSLRALLVLVPPTVSVLRPGGERSVPPDEVLVGDVMVLRPGERAATDGVIRAGRTSLDTSAITGESVLVEAGPGDTVHAGTINGTGAIEVRVSAPASDSSLARIVHIVEQAQERKGSGQRLADRIARPLVPAIMILAVLVAALGLVLGEPLLWLERALVVLVAASPCALAISVPLTVVAAVGASSRHGALIKGGAALEELGRIGAVALDKTGTLTRNRPQVIGIVTTPGHDQPEVLAAAAALEARSEHPLARAILAAAHDPRRPAPASPAEDVVAVPGHGLTGHHDGARLRLGKPGWVDAGQLTPQVEQLQGAGATVVLVERDDAPALATADIGIAMGTMGTDVAIETADVALMGEDLRLLPQTLAHARRARTIMLQNVGLSLLIIGALVPLAAFGVLGLATVVVIHESAEVLVILNAIRAARATPLPGRTAAPVNRVSVAAAPAPADACCAPAHELAPVVERSGCACCADGEPAGTTDVGRAAGPASVGSTTNGASPTASSTRPSWSRALRPDDLPS